MKGSEQCLPTEVVLQMTRIPQNKFLCLYFGHPGHFAASPNSVDPATVKPLEQLPPEDTGHGLLRILKFQFTDSSFVSTGNSASAEQGDPLLGASRRICRTFCTIAESLFTRNISEHTCACHTIHGYRFKINELNK